jgi:hypothetical protein
MQIDQAKVNGIGVGCNLERAPEWPLETRFKVLLRSLLPHVGIIEATCRDKQSGQRAFQHGLPMLWFGVMDCRHACSFLE